MTKFRNVFLFLLILLLIASTLGALFVFAHRSATPATNTVSSSTSPIVGHVYFLSSGQLYVHNNQGINDQVLIDLHHLAAPAAGRQKPF